jgi:hypothetical protein
MRIIHQSEGGLAYLPGLQKPVEIDADALDAASGQELQRLVEAAGFFDLPPTVGSNVRGAADVQTDTLTIEHGGRRHSVRVLSAPADGPLRELLGAVRTQVKAQRAKLRVQRPSE